MRRNVILLFVAAVLLTSFWMVFQETPQTTVQMQEAPDFSWQGADASHHRLSELGAKPVVLHFWASWCAPCREEFPALIVAARRNKNIIFLTVSGDEDGARAEAFIHQYAGQELPDNLLVAVDSTHALAFDMFQTVQYPETILLDSAHHLRRKFPGPVDWKGKDVQDYLNQLR